MENHIHTAATDTKVVPYACVPQGHKEAKVITQRISAFVMVGRIVFLHAGKAHVTAHPGPGYATNGTYHSPLFYGLDIPLSVGYKLIRAEIRYTGYLFAQFLGGCNPFKDQFFPFGVHGFRIILFIINSFSVTVQVESGRNLAALGIIFLSSS